MPPEKDTIRLVYACETKAFMGSEEHIHVLLYVLQLLCDLLRTVHHGILAEEHGLFVVCPQGPFQLTYTIFLYNM